MTLTGVPLLVLFVVGLVLALAGTVALWIRPPGPVLAWPLRIACLALVIVLPIGLTADVVNRSLGFYSSWSDLLNSPGDARLAAAAQLRHQQLPTADLHRAAELAARGHGSIVPWTIPGPKSGITRNGLVYLPAAYFDRARPQQRFPVIELLHGYSGSPGNWAHALHIASFLDTEIAAGRIPPVIAVAPKLYDTHDGECVDAVRGQRNETYLAVDVPADISGAFRTATAPGSWATLGFSTGGFCAVNMALHYPRRYRAAVSLSGYFTAITDPTTGNLYRGNAAVRRANSPQWWVRHHPVQPALYVFASGGDRSAMRAARAFRAVVHNADLTTVTVPSGGHNIGVWKAALPPALDWLGQRIPGPTSPAVVESPS
ncbi:alpha/beta hydrolase [Cryptosporangium phraense]|uniref:Alpha/beta fold hydrolase n=1 Tax=Cryptosporangium phraense TaxID=2593070 RepID=A0A545AXR1_9ACTN|nr:alpha/beta hydrolase-fold protein [Cryptosporangium phraense]TQS46088.1 alpha/beta fold hydrolase [Cryptosporangium phraense]